MKKLKLPIFGFPLYMSNDQVELQSLVKKKLMDNVQSEELQNAIDDSRGITIKMTTPDGSFYRIMAVFDGDISIVAHEAVHTAYSILECADIKTDKDNDEMLAYLTGWLTKEFVKHFGSEVKCKKQNGSKRSDSESVAQNAPQF